MDYAKVQLIQVMRNLVSLHHTLAHQHFLIIKNKIKVERYEDFTQWQLVFDHPNFTKKDIDNILSSAYQSYYLNQNGLLNF